MTHRLFAFFGLYMCGCLLAFDTHKVLPLSAGSTVVVWFANPCGYNKTVVKPSLSLLIQTLTEKYLRENSISGFKCCYLIL